VFSHTVIFITLVLIGAHQLATTGVDQASRHLEVYKMIGISVGDGVHGVERIAASHERNADTGEKQSREVRHDLTCLAGKNEADVQRLPGNLIDLLDVEIFVDEPTHD